MTFDLVELWSFLNFSCVYTFRHYTVTEILTPNGCDYNTFQLLMSAVFNNTYKCTYHELYESVCEAHATKF